MVFQSIELAKVGFDEGLQLGVGRIDDISSALQRGTSPMGGNPRDEDLRGLVGNMARQLPGNGPVQFIRT